MEKSHRRNIGFYAIVTYFMTLNIEIVEDVLSQTKHTVTLET